MVGLTVVVAGPIVIGPPRGTMVAKPAIPKRAGLETRQVVFKASLRDVGEAKMEGVAL
jgi:hypothetical protein